MFTEITDGHEACTAGAGIDRFAVRNILRAGGQADGRRLTYGILDDPEPQIAADFVKPAPICLAESAVVLVLSPVHQVHATRCHEHYATTKLCSELLLVMNHGV